MGLKFQPRVAKGQFLTGTSLVFSRGHQTSAVSPAALWLVLCLYGHFTPDWLHLIRPTTSTGMPSLLCIQRKRLSPQHSKHIWFSHRGWRAETVVLSPGFDVRLWAWRTCNILYSWNQGWSFPVLTANPALCPTDSKRPGFSQPVERSPKGLIASRL